MLTDIVLDAMGSDKAPEPEIRGAISACRHFPVRVHLVGPENLVAPALKQHLMGERLPIEVVHASEWISMDDKAAQAVRQKRDSSMRVGLKLVREGKARGFVTAGNTGAAMATAKMVLGTLQGVDRPALATLLPTQSGSPCVMLDSGANVDSDPHNIVQFALMGQIYNAVTRETLPLLRELYERGVMSHFLGNVEGRDLFNGRCDVVACDGFVGNVALKTTEGIAKLISESLKQTLKATITSQVGALLSRKAFNNFKKRLDYSEYGGAPLLGVRGACIIGHGSSNETAILNAIRVASQFAQADVSHHIEASLAAANGAASGASPTE